MAQQSPRTSILPMQRRPIAPRDQETAPTRGRDIALPPSSTAAAERPVSLDDYDTGTPLTLDDYQAGTPVEGPIARGWAGLSRAGLTPSGIWEGTKGLINLALAGPKEAQNAVFNAVIAPPLRMFDPQTRSAVVRSTLSPFGTDTSGMDKLRAAEVLPIVGPSYTQARKSIEAGDVAGGVTQAAGTTAAPFLRAPAPVLNLLQTGTEALGLGAQAGATGLARGFGRAALHSGAEVPAAVTEAAVDSALQNRLLRTGILSGQRKAARMASDITEGAAAAAGPGRVDPAAIFGPDRTGGAAVQAAKRNIGPKGGLTVEQVPFVDEQVGRIANDPRLIGEPIESPSTGQVVGRRGPVQPRAADVINYAEMLDRDALTAGNTNAQTVARNAVATDARAAVEAAHPATAPFFRQIESLNPGRQGLANAIQTGAPVGSSYRALIRSMGFAPPADALFGLSQRLPGAAAQINPAMAAALRAAILQRLQGDTSGR